MAFKKESVLVDIYEMTRANTANINQKDGEPIMTDRIQTLIRTIDKNSSYKDTRRWSEVLWDETATLQTEAGNADWFDYVKEELTYIIKAFKNEIKFPTNEDYREAISNQHRRGGVQLKKTNDYIASLEDDLDIVVALEGKFKLKESQYVDFSEDEEVVEPTMDELKAIIKEEDLGVRVSKTDTIKKIQDKIAKARK